MPPKLTEKRSSGCNTFTGVGEWPGDRSNFAVTARVCANSSLMEQGSVYLRDLMTTETAAIDGDTMTATDADGNIVLVFERVAS